MTDHVWIPYVRRQIHHDQEPAPELAVRCPWCGSKPNRPCTSASGKRLRGFHDSRRKAAAVMPKVVPGSNGGGGRA